MLLLKIHTVLCLFPGTAKSSEISLHFGQSGLNSSVTSPYFTCKICATGQVSQRDSGISVLWAFKSLAGCGP